MGLLLLIENGVGRRIVVHLHLSVHLHVLSAGGDVLEQLVYGSTQVLLLFAEHAPFVSTALTVLIGSFCSLHLLSHEIGRAHV